MNNTDDIEEVEVWVKFSVTHCYKKDSAGKLQYVSSKYFKLDPFSVEPSEQIDKAQLIDGLEPESPA